MGDTDGTPPEAINQSKEWISPNSARGIALLKSFKGLERIQDDDIQAKCLDQIIAAEGSGYTNKHLQASCQRTQRQVTTAIWTLQRRIEHFNTMQASIGQPERIEYESPGRGWYLIRLCSMKQTETAPVRGVVIQVTDGLKRDPHYATSFWRPHTEKTAYPEKGISIFVSVPTFFRARGQTEDLIFRLTELNVDDPGRARAQLETDFKRHWDESVRSSNLYLLFGEVMARNTLEQFFRHRFQKDWEDICGEETKERRFVKQKLDRKCDLQDSRFKHRSSVLLGSFRTSDLSHYAFEEVCAQFHGFPFRPGRRGTVTVDLKVVEASNDALKYFQAEGASLCSSKAMTLKDDAAGSLDPDRFCILRDREPRDRVFGVITRAPHPCDDHTDVVTFLSCDATRALESISDVLTDNETVLRKWIDMAGWKNGWPKRFQILLSQGMSPDDEPVGSPSILSWWSST